MRVVGLDVGGTAVKVGTLEANGDRRAGTPLPTDLARGMEDFLDRLAELVRAQGPAERVGLGVPGVFRTDTGILSRSANLPQMVGHDLIGELARRLDWAPERICVGNDANLAAFAEHGFGAGRGTADMLMVTLGTGVGGGVVMGGELVQGPGGKAGEVGHLVVRSRAQGGTQCGCGSFGCLETLVSATAAMRRARDRQLEPDLPQLTARARAASGPERDLMNEIGRDLGAGLALAVTLLDLSLFVVGGGFGAALDVLAPPALEVLAERNYGNDPATLVAAELGESAGWIGAARLAQTGA